MRPDYEFLKMTTPFPLQFVGATPGTRLLSKNLRDTQCFDTYEQLYVFFRRVRPEGRWLVWIRDANGNITSIRSDTWEEAMADVPIEESLARIRGKRRSSADETSSND